MAVVERDVSLRGLLELLLQEHVADLEAVRLVEVVGDLRAQVDLPMPEPAVSSVSSPLRQPISFS
jgi:hypothetical protein